MAEKILIGKLVINAYSIKFNQIDSEILQEKKEETKEENDESDQDSEDLEESSM